MYIAIMMDRKVGGPAFIVSPQGGMDIETVAKETPDAIFVVCINIHARGIILSFSIGTN